MSRQKISLNKEVYSFDPFPQLLNKTLIPYYMSANNMEKKDYIFQEDLDKLLFPFTYTIEYSFNPLNRRQFRYTYLIILKNYKIKKIIKFD